MMLNKIQHFFTFTQLKLVIVLPAEVTTVWKWLLLKAYGKFVYLCGSFVYIVLWFSFLRDEVIILFPFIQPSSFFFFTTPESGLPPG